jgi:formamidopyrimidine-DNA glycosylase
MYELPEAAVVAGQIGETCTGKIIQNVTAGYTPHKLAWYYGEPQGFEALLEGRRMGEARSVGGFVEIQADGATILLGEGVNIRFHGTGEQRPSKHQMLIEFEDGCALSCAIQMYGGMGAFLEGTMDNKYYIGAKSKPSPLGAGFDRAYFDTLLHAEGMDRLSAKAFLATEQRIPGLGNGALQDILYNAKIHPKRKMGTLTEAEIDILYDAILSTLAEMAALGGRDIERDLFGCPGGYTTRLSKNTVGTPCGVCGDVILKENYMGGSIYSCGGCQQL